jgi:hypothetical protein
MRKKNKIKMSLNLSPTFCDLYYNHHFNKTSASWRLGG